MLRSSDCFATGPASVIAAELGISDKAVFVYASRVLKAVRKQCAALAEELGMSRSIGASRKVTLPKLESAGRPALKPPLDARHAPGLEQSHLPASRG